MLVMQVDDQEECINVPNFTINIHCSLEDLQGRSEIDCADIDTINDLIKSYCALHNVPNPSNFVLQTADGKTLRKTLRIKKCGVHEGQVLYLLMSSQDSFRRNGRHYCSLAIISFIIAVCLLAAVIVVSVYPKQSVFQYGVVFDAGSSHTKSFVYKWPGQKQNGTGAIEEIWRSNATEKGISAYSVNPTSVKESLEPIIKKTKKVLKKPSETPIYLGATAGMRLLKQRNPKAADSILDAVREAFSSTSFHLKNETQNVRILSGEEEGTDSWVAVNYILNKFGTMSVFNLVKENPKTVGALDMGGASTQITFDSYKQTIPKAYSQNLTLFGWKFKVYTHSYSCYGLDEIKNRYFAHLINKNKTGTGPIKSFCLPSGYNQTLNSTDIFQLPCTNRTTNNKEEIYTFIGQSNDEGCKNELDQLFNWKNCPYGKGNCSFNGVYMPNLKNVDEFLAFSGFCYPVSFLNLTTCKKAEKFSYKSFQNARANFCNKTWTEISNIPKKDKFKWIYCMQMHYIEKLLVKGYGFNGSNWKKLTFRQDINGTVIGWAPGFMLRVTNSLPTVLPSPLIGLAIFIVIVCLLVVFCVFGVAYSMIWRRFLKAKRYQRLEHRIAPSI
ncbi:DgyrCDS93 [Dimorphilus gyrociliatus]|uniref:DgyrCDS93 n=1 Tax=Dimorphilus gyrociliatus TaxID=2664684 RepID=A0A7I8V3U7_9ANNE|nr:DgyrCDS93 [Dimorphilus gyrociliatus]